MMKNCDPRLTDNGKFQSLNAGRSILENIIKKEEYKPLLENMIDNVFKD
jgi:hypothetical protein